MLTPKRNAVTCVNKKLMAVIELSGPAILVGDDTMKKTFEILLSILHKKHQCQISEEEDGSDSQEMEESSEYDWLVIESAMDCIVAIAKALGSNFTALWKECSKPILKYASSSDPSERAAATGTLAELILALDNSVTPFTAQLLKTMMHRMTDEDRVTKANAIYAIGLLCALSEDQATTVGQYSAILRKLESLLSDDGAAGHLLDNAAGCVARMIIAKPDKVPLAEVLPRLVELMPTKEDHEVNGPLFQCIVRLCKHPHVVQVTILTEADQLKNPVVQQLTPQVMTAIRKISQEPEDHLDDKTRGQLKELVHYLETMSL
jgi:importin-4